MTPLLEGLGIKRRRLYTCVFPSWSMSSMLTAIPMV
jgi:hypothetical protein